MLRVCDCIVKYVSFLCEPERVVPRSSLHLVCSHLSCCWDTQVDYVSLCVLCVSGVFVCLHISVCEPGRVVAWSSARSIYLHLSELLKGVLHAWVHCVSLSICLLVKQRCVSLLVRVEALDVGRIGTIKDL